MSKFDPAKAQEALDRVLSHDSLINYPAIYEGFGAKGIPEADIKPRENVFTYNAWRALKRQVRRNEHGVKVITYVVMSKKDPKTGEIEEFKAPRTTTVFHITQTDPVQ